MIFLPSRAPVLCDAFHYRIMIVHDEEVLTVPIVEYQYQRFEMKMQFVITWGKQQETGTLRCQIKDKTLKVGVQN